MVVNGQKQDIQDIHQQVEYFQNQAVAKHKAGESAAAVDFYLQAISLEQNQPDWLYGNAITLLGQLEQFDQGLELGNRALSLYPESPDLYRAIGIVCENKEDTLNCIQKYSKAIELEPNQPDWLYCNLSKQLLKANQIQAAVKISSQGAKLYDIFYPLHYILGQALAAQEQWEEAILAYQKVQLLNPDWTEIKQKLNQAILSLLAKMFLQKQSKLIQ
jgi:tetratricopeptide (TPR) repeat protein